MVLGERGEQRPRRTEKVAVSRAAKLVGGKRGQVQEAGGPGGQEPPSNQRGEAAYSLGRPQGLHGVAGVAPSKEETAGQRGAGRRGWQHDAPALPAANRAGRRQTADRARVA